jgi:uncharacterized alpha-E superfamily protein
MLSRTAEHLYWMGRYIERADATARLIEMGRRMVMLPGASGEWRSVARASGAAGELGVDPKASADAIILRLLVDGENASSISSCLVRARGNARAIRTAITQDMWEALNDNWRKLEGVTSAQALSDLPQLLDWVRQRSAAFRGATETGLLRNDGFLFLRLGELVERTEMTLRLLDVKYYVLLPESDVVGGGRDFHQWTAVLRALSAQRAYHHVYRGDYTPWHIAEFLILNKIFPRSANFCYRSISNALDELAFDYGERHDCHATADEMVMRFGEAEIQKIFQSGLHEFITSAVRTTNRLSSEIAKAYHF